MSSSARWISKNRRPGNGSSRASALTTSAPTSGYNPVSGDFHTFKSPTGPNKVVPNGRFGAIEETDDDNSGSHISEAGVEDDVASNAESLSGESAEENREKPAELAPPQPRPEPIPGADDDNWEKMRQKNERKHQRQKEKRAQELNDKCNGYLMSRKLEVLSDQLVAMGFSKEQATMALIVNEGKVEQSVGWLFDAGEKDRERYYERGGSGGALKIDISAELARINDMVAKYGAPKADVQRAVVSSEGDIEKADGIVKAQKEEPRVATPEENEGRAGSVNSVKVQQVAPVRSNTPRVQPRPYPTPNNAVHQRRDGRDFIHARGQAVARGSSVAMGSKNVQMFRRKQPPNRPEWPTLQQQQQMPAAPVEKKWPDGGAARPVGSLPPAPPLRLSPRPSKPEPHEVLLTDEVKNLQFGSRKGPVVIQRPLQSKSVPRQGPTAASRGPHVNPIEPPKPPEAIQRPSAPTKSVAPNKVSASKPMYVRRTYQSQQKLAPPNISGSPADPQGTVQVSSSGVVDLGGTPLPLGSASSAGLYNAGMRPKNGPRPSNDWRTGMSRKFDYRDVDWSLNSGPVTPTSGGLWSKSAYTVPQEQNAPTYELFGKGSLANSNLVGPAVGDGPEGLGWLDELEDDDGMAGLCWGSVGAFQDGGGIAGGFSSTGWFQDGGGMAGFGSTDGYHDGGGVAAFGSTGGFQYGGGMAGFGSIDVFQDGGGMAGFCPISPLKGSSGGGAVGLGPIGPTKGSIGGGAAGLSPVGPMKGSIGGSAAGFGPKGGGAVGLGPIGVFKGSSGGGAAGLGDEGGNGSTREWTSPFEENDIFGITRQFVFSPPR